MEAVLSEDDETSKQTKRYLVLAQDGKAKRVPLKDFPVQGRYGRGVIAWEMPLGVTLAGLAIGKGTHTVTLHLRKAAPKMTRLRRSRPLVSVPSQ